MELKVDPIKAVPVPMRLGNRLLLAMTCWRCGNLMPGNKFHKHYRNARDKSPYIDRRCADCKWGSRVKGKRNASDKLGTDLV